MANERKEYPSLLFANMSFCQGLASTLDIGDTLIVYNTSITAAEADRKALAYDWQTVGNDIYGAMESYEQTL